MKRGEEAVAYSSLQVTFAGDGGIYNSWRKCNSNIQLPLCLFLWDEKWQSVIRAQTRDIWKTHPILFSSVQLLSCVQLFATPWIAAHQASLSITNSQSPLKLMSIESVMPSSHLILCCPFLLLPSIPPSSRVFSSESVFCIRWPRNWSFSFSISPSNEQTPRTDLL